MRKLMIVDPEQNYDRFLKEALAEDFQIHNCVDFFNAREEIISFAPDYLILSFATSLFDGFTLLRTVRSMGLRPGVIGIVQRFNFFTNQLLDELDVVSVLSAPFCRETILSNVTNIAKFPPDKLVPLPSRDKLLGYILSSLGMPEEAAGSISLIHLIPRLAAEPALLYTKELYPEIGKLTGHTGQQVERNIRSAIEAGWRRQRYYAWSLYFPCDSEGFVKKPSNSEFISLMVKVLQRQRGNYTDD